MKKSGLLVTLFLIAMMCKAQDAQFSQFYAAPLNINPAYAGNTDNATLYLNERMQWPSSNMRSHLSSVSLDFISVIPHAGFGLILQNSFDVSTKQQSNMLGICYSYNIVLHKRFSIRPGLQTTLLNRVLGNDLLFGDQYDSYGRLVNTSSVDNTSKKMIFAPDISAGLMAFSRQDFWIGVAAHHLNRPNISFYSVSKSRLPVLWSVNGGYNFGLSNKYKSGGLRVNSADYSSAMTPVFSYRLQDGFEMLDLGLYYFTYPVCVAFWYRGIPIKKYQDVRTNQAFVVLAGLKFARLKIAYSYDINLSKLKGTGGAHELSIAYSFSSSYHNNRGYVPSPSW